MVPSRDEMADSTTGRKEVSRYSKEERRHLIQLTRAPISRDGNHKGESAKGRIRKNAAFSFYTYLGLLKNLPINIAMIIVRYN